MKKYRLSHIFALIALVLTIQLILYFYYHKEESATVPPTECINVRDWVLSYDNPYIVFIIILSSAENVERRQAIRATWLHGIQINLSHIGYKFVIANNEDLMEQVEKEQLLHRDIVLFSDIEESYSTLPSKVVASFKWVNKNIRTDFVLKCDDDSFVVIDKLLETIKVEGIPHSRMYWGYFYGHASIKRSGKWGEENWNLCDKYLPFAFGGGYILSSDLVNYLVINSNYLQQYNNEDVTIGAWLATLAITRRHDTRFNTEAKSRGCSNSYLITHRETPDSMRDKHKHYKKTGMICKEEFNVIAGYMYNWNVLPSLCCHRIAGLE